MTFQNIKTLTIVLQLSFIFGCRQNPCNRDNFLRDFADASTISLHGYTNSNIFIAKDSILGFIEFLETRKECDELNITVKSELAVSYERLAQIYEKLNLDDEVALYRNQSQELESFIISQTGLPLDVRNIVSASYKWLVPGWLTDKVSDVNENSEFECKVNPAIQ